MSGYTWAGPPSAPWQKLVVGDLPVLDHGFPLKVQTVQRGPRKEGDVVAAYPVLSYSALPQLMGRSAATLTLEPVVTQDYDIVGSYQTKQGLLTEMTFNQEREPGIVDLHKLYEAARQAGGALVYVANYPFAYAEPVPMRSESVDLMSLTVVTAGGFVAGLMIMRALR